MAEKCGFRLTFSSLVVDQDYLSSKVQLSNQHRWSYGSILLQRTLREAWDVQVPSNTSSVWICFEHLEKNMWKPTWLWPDRCTSWSLCRTATLAKVPYNQIIKISKISFISQPFAVRYQTWVCQASAHVLSKPSLPWSSWRRRCHAPMLPMLRRCQRRRHMPSPPRCVQVGVNQKVNHFEFGWFHFHGFSCCSFFFHLWPGR